MATMENIDLDKVILRLRQWVAFLGVRRLVMSLGSAIALMAVAWFVMKPTPVPVEAFVPQVTAVPTTGTVNPTPGRIMVHVAGAVTSPGVYQLQSTARVVDAIDAAGGALRQADLESINLAQTIVDTEQVFVPTKKVSRPRVTVAPRLRPHRNTATTLPAAGGNGSSTPKLVNLNTATASELETLTGVGPSTAKAILAYRTKKGSFSKVEDLLNVPGIGPAKLAAMRDEVSVG